jgi:hypothetical protein
MILLVVAAYTPLMFVVLLTVGQPYNLSLFMFTDIFEALQINPTGVVGIYAPPLLGIISSSIFYAALACYSHPSRWRRLDPDR